MDPHKQQQLFQEKYEEKFGMTYQEWTENAPNTEEQAYTRLQEIDQELKSTEEDWREATGLYKQEIEDYRDRLKLEYDLLEELFGLALDE